MLKPEYGPELLARWRGRCGADERSSRPIDAVLPSGIPLRQPDQKSCYETNFQSLISAMTWGRSL